MRDTEDRVCSGCGNFVDVRDGWDWEEGDRCWLCEIEVLKSKLSVAKKALKRISGGDCVLTNSRPIKDGCHCVSCSARTALKTLEKKNE